LASTNILLFFFLSFSGMSKKFSPVDTGSPVSLSNFNLATLATFPPLLEASKCS